MQKYLDKTAKTEEEAVAAALRELGLDRDDVSVEILDRAKSGFLGLGATPARVRVSYETPDESPEPEPVAEAPVKQAPAPPKTEPVKPRPEEKPTKTAEVNTPELSGDELKDRAVAFVSGILERMGVSADIEVSDRDNGGILLSLNGDGMGAVIGRRGETLDAIQHLANYAVNRGSEKRRHISVDAENYRSKREESLVRLAEKMASKVLKYKRSMALEPMNSYERHVIHAALQDFEGVTTASTGVEPNRRVVVSFERQSRDGGRPQQREDRRPPRDNAARSPRPPRETPKPPVEQPPKPQSREWS